MPNIIQLTTTPVDSCERITKDWFDMEDELLRTVAEYVRNDENPEETIRAFQTCLTTGNPHAEPFHTDEHRGIFFRHGFREAYFQEAFESFVRLSGKLAKETTLDSFIHDGPEGDLYALQEAYNERFGWYVYFDEMTMTLDDFMRHSAKVGERYYYGGTVYYHS